MTRFWPALLAFLLLAPAAQASTASREGNAITIVGGDEANNVSVGGGGFYYHVNDAAGITPGPGCEQWSPTSVRCGSSSDYNLDVVNASLGAGDDVFTLAGSYNQTVSGGPGNDSITTGALNDVVHGDDGNDYVSAGPGADQAFGDAGNDEVRGHNGSDEVTGGAGLDILYGDGGDGTVAAQGSDRIYSRDAEQDQVNCGLGADSVTADDVDLTDEFCESVDRSSTSPDPGPGPSPTPDPDPNPDPDPAPDGPDFTAPGLAIDAPLRLGLNRATRRPGVLTTVEVDEDCLLEATLTISRHNARRHGLSRRAMRLDSGRADVTPGEWEVQLWASGRKARKLRALAARRGTRTVPAQVRVKCTDAADNWRQRSATVKLTG